MPDEIMKSGECNSSAVASLLPRYRAAVSGCLLSEEQLNALAPKFGNPKLLLLLPVILEQIVEHLDIGGRILGLKWATLQWLFITGQLISVTIGLFALLYTMSQLVKERNRRVLLTLNAAEFCMLPLAPLNMLVFHSFVSVYRSMALAGLGDFVGAQLVVARSRWSTGRSRKLMTETALTFARIYAAAGDYSRAYDMFFHAYTNGSKSSLMAGNKAILAMNLGWALMLQDNFIEAKERLEEALTLANRTGIFFAHASEYIKACILSILARTHLRLGDFESCETHLHEAMHLIGKRKNFHDVIVGVNTGYAELRLAQNRAADAEAYARAALQLEMQRSYPGGVTRDYLLRLNALILRCSGRLAEADQLDQLASAEMYELSARNQGKLQAHKLSAQAPAITTKPQ